MILANQIELWEMENNKGFFDDCYIPSSLNRTALFDYLYLEYSDMQTIDGNWNTFHRRVLNFFTIHKYELDGLAESISYEYEPLDNFNSTQVLGRKTDKGSDSSTVEHTNNTENWNENGKQFQQNVNLVSAYNDNESPTLVGTDSDGNPIYKYIDTEHHRDIENRNYSSHGDKTDAFNRGEETVATSLENVGEQILKHGNNGVSYQSLIEEERKLREFNIYKWIARHFSTELLVCVW